METTRSATVVGTAMALTGVVAFSAKAVLVKLCFQYDVDALTILLLRMAFALPFYIVITIVDAYRNPSAPLTGKDGLWMVALGLMGYFMSSFLDFSGLKYIPAGMERLILFVYPTIVVLLSKYTFGKPVTRRQLVAIGITYVGIAAAFGGRFSTGSSDGTMTGVVLVFFAAVSYAFYLVGSGNMIPRVGIVRFTGYAMMVSCAAVIATFAAAGKADVLNLPGPVYGYTLIMAVFSTVLPTYLISAATSKIGASSVSILGSAGPFLTVGLEVMLLGETVGVFQALGTAIVIAGIVYLNKKPN